MKALADAELMDGNLVAQQVRKGLKEGIAAAVAAGGRRPCLAVIRVGEDPASAVYVRNKRRAAEAIGMESRETHLSAEVSESALLEEVRRLNQDPSVDGVLVQLPLPRHLSPDRVLQVLDPDKDVDGLTVTNLGRLCAGQPHLVPCTPRGILTLLDHYQVPLAGRRAVVVGRSRLVGLPVALLLLQRHASVSIVHSRTPDPAAYTREAEVLVVAAGRRHLIGPDWVRPGATVIDVGIHRTEDGLAGDVDYERVRTVAGRITPVPGGVGPMTVAMLLANTWTAYRRREGPTDAR